MATNPPLFGPEHRRPEEVLDEVAARLDELITRDASSGRDRIRPWMDHGATFAVVATVAIVGTVLGLTALIGATRPDAPPPASDVPLAAVESPELAQEPALEQEPEEQEVAVAPPLPLTLRIDTIGVDAQLVSVGLEPDGAMEIPDDVRKIGWYDPDDLGVRPGTTGTAVFASHVDSRTQGRGVLFELRQLRVGDTVDIDLEDGTTQTWVVTEVAQTPKVEMPLAEIFTWAGSPRVVIITCGGEFDRSTRSYLDNIVVYAEPLDAPSA